MIWSSYLAIVQYQRSYSFVLILESTIGSHRLLINLSCYMSMFSSWRESSKFLTQFSYTLLSSSWGYRSSASISDNINICPRFPIHDTFPNFINPAYYLISFSYGVKIECAMFGVFYQCRIYISSVRKYMAFIVLVVWHFDTYV